MCTIYLHSNSSALIRKRPDPSRSSVKYLLQHLSNHNQTPRTETMNWYMNRIQWRNNQWKQGWDEEEGWDGLGEDQALHEHVYLAGKTGSSFFFLCICMECGVWLPTCTHVEARVFLSYSITYCLWDRVSHWIRNLKSAVYSYAGWLAGWLAHPPSGSACQSTTTPRFSPGSWWLWFTLWPHACTASTLTDWSAQSQTPYS